MRAVSSISRPSTNGLGRGNALTVIPGREQRVRPLAGPMTGSASEPGIHDREYGFQGLRQVAHPGMTGLNQFEAWREKLLCQLP
jgi:hypothetical protein